MTEGLSAIGLRTGVVRVCQLDGVSRVWLGFMAGCGEAAVDGDVERC